MANEDKERLLSLLDSIEWFNHNEDYYDDCEIAVIRQYLVDPRTFQPVTIIAIHAIHDSSTPSIIGMMRVGDMETVRDINSSNSEWDSNDWLEVVADYYFNDISDKQIKALIMLRFGNGNKADLAHKMIHKLKEGELTHE